MSRLGRIVSCVALAAAATVCSTVVARQHAGSDAFVRTHPAGAKPTLVEPRILPPIEPALPRFGMETVQTGWGERVVNVYHGSLAWRLGLERGDTIVRLNGFRLNHRGAWRSALRDATRGGGYVRLAIRDVRTGRLVHRETTIPGFGGAPIPRYRSAKPLEQPLPTSKLERTVRRFLLP